MTAVDKERLNLIKQWLAGTLDGKIDVNATIFFLVSKLDEAHKRITELEELTELDTDWWG